MRKKESLFFKVANFEALHAIFRKPRKNSFYPVRPADFLKQIPIKFKSPPDRGAVAFFTMRLKR